MDPEYDESEVDITANRRRQSFWSKLGGPALSFAILLHAVVLILGAIWIFQIVKIPEKKVDFMPGGGGGGGERGAETKVNSKKRAQITPSTSVKRVFAEGAVSNFSIPDPGDTFGQMSSLSSLSGGGASGGLGGSGSGKGFGSGSGSGMGSGHGSGKLFGLIPDTMGKRCSKEDRLARLKETGGTPECEEAVVKALRWLKANQSPDGSWPATGMGKWGASPSSMTGLALLAFFGHCETPASEEFGDTTLRGITYLVNLGMKTDGRLSSNLGAQAFCYEHAIATYALAEAATFYKSLKDPPPNLAEITQKAGQYIIDHQNENKGWAYGYLTKGGNVDLSVVGWQIQALKACSHTGLAFKGMNNSVSKGLRYVNDLQEPQSGGFGYNKPAPSDGDYFTLTGVGMLCNQMWGKGSRTEVDKGARYIIKHSRFDYNTKFSDLYGHYYESQAMMQRGGKEWDHYNAMFRDQLLKNQNPDGSWKVPGGGAKIRAVAGNETYGVCDVYRTCLCTLMLEVYYRFLSTGNSGGGI